MQKITEFVPGEEVVWRVSDSNLSFLKDKSEWNGTDVVFEISEKVGKTDVRFIHARAQNRVLRKLLERMGSAHQ